MPVRASRVCGANATLVFALALSCLLPHAAAAATLLGMRSWPAPASSRVVFDFSDPVTYAGPDSGSSPSLTLALPGEHLALGPGVPVLLGVRDSVVDSVRVTFDDAGTRLEIAFSDTTTFRVFTLAAEEDKPFRIVVDVSRPGAEAAEEKRLAAIAAAKRAARVRLVAVDAGHGGEDTGARGPHGVLEKNVTLGVAKALVAELNRIPGIQGVLTRRGDYFVPLRERYHIAERMKADLFVSVHCNSSRRRGSGNGTEVFFLSLHGASDQADADLANLENAADLVGGVPARADDDLVNILYDVKRAAALEKSQLLAESLLDHLATDHRLESRGVKQAGFAVLKSVEFPSVLVETAFINNPAEAKLLRSANFQLQLGRQIATGVASYFERPGIILPGSSGDSTGKSGR
ncbi:MAG: N-acetylmuramoyl-L-alanine amidase [Candidatus Eisenbacteria bacterium]|nr:N-acetylmuramoyl-L-alanine amidase [Candidatus Eisenbacteria bacterium]